MIAKVKRTQNNGQRNMEQTRIQNIGTNRNDESTTTEPPHFTGTKSLPYIMLLLTI